MTLYATTVIPALDLTSGVDTLHRLSSPVVSVSHIGWNQKDHLFVAVLKTETPLVLNQLDETLKRFNVQLDRASYLGTALRRANQIAKVEVFDDIREDKLNQI